MAIQAPSSEYSRALAENERYAGQFDRSSLPLPPGKKLAVLACMDARLTVEDVLGLRTGDAHIIPWIKDVPVHGLVYEAR